MFISLKRVFKFAWQGFLRNRVLGLEVMFIMAIAVFLITSLFLFQGISDFLIKEVQNKVDVSVYFKETVLEDDILSVERDLYKFSNEIESVEYVSREKALENFIEKHKDEPIYLEALQEIGYNPFLPSLNIKARDPSYYAPISNYLNQDSLQGIIERVSFFQNKKVIDKLSSITANVKTVFISLSLILGLLAVLITFNTIKLTIFTSKEEISTMQLVGASNWFIRGPFVIQGIFYGIVSVLAVNLLFLITFAFFSYRLETFFLGFNLLNYFQMNFLPLLLIQIAFAGILAIFSTLLALHKYLKV
jgi:cell division transport system permease protein